MSHEHDIDVDMDLGPEFFDQVDEDDQNLQLNAFKLFHIANRHWGEGKWSHQLQLEKTPPQPRTLPLSGSQHGHCVSITCNCTISHGDESHTDFGIGCAAHTSYDMAVRIATQRARQEAIVNTFAAFGNVFGQCAYDKEYMKQMMSMDVPRRTIQDSTSYHHPRYDPHDLVKRPAPPKQATQEKNDSPFMKKLSESMTLPTPSASSSSTSTPVPEIPKKPSRKAKAATKHQSEAVNEPSASVTADLPITASSSGAPLEEKSDTVEGIAPVPSQEEDFQDDQPLLRTYKRLRQRNDPKSSSKGHHKKKK